MDMRGKEPASVFATIGVHGDLPVEVRLAPHGMEAVEINVGVASELIMDFADMASLERLRDAAAEGVRLLRERIEQNRRGRSAAGDADRLIGSGHAVPTAMPRLP
jgi:hypothetical protein